MIFTLEIAAHSLQSCISAEKGGAHRIELCTALQTGGLTPSLALLRLARENVSLPIHVLIRPRVGDFNFTALEMKEMITAIHICRDEGASGIVTGCLTPDGAIHQWQLERLFEAAEGLEKTFHRAFDLVKDPFLALHQLKQLGCDRILTSGQRKTAHEGSPLIKKLVTAASGEIAILAGAGVNSQNILALARDTGVQEFHGSAKQDLPGSSLRDSIGITHLAGRNITNHWESDPAEIRAMVEALKGYTH